MPDKIEIKNKESSKDFLKEYIPVKSDINILFRKNKKTQEYELLSGEVEKLTGYSIEEINKKGFNKIILETIEKERLEPDVVVTYHMIERSSGSKEIFEELLFPNHIDENNKEFAYGVLKNITKLCGLLNDLSEIKVKLEKVTEMPNVIFAIIDDDDTVKFINERGCDILDIKKRDILGKKWYSYFRENLPDEVKDITKKIFKNVIPPQQDYELKVKTPQGKWLDTIWNNEVIRDNNDEIRYIVASGEDITERKRNEKVQKTISDILEMANSESELVDLFDFIHKAIAELMPTENFYIALFDKDNNLIYFPYFVDKYDKEAPPKRFGKGLTEYVLSEGTSALIDLEKDTELIEKGETELMGTQSAIWLGVPLKIQENTIGVMAVQDYEDKTTYTEEDKKILEVISYPISRAIERKRVESERRKLIAELKEMNESKDKLFSLISHDLRSPFNSLLGFSDILTSEYDSLTHDEIKEYLNVIYDTSKNLFQMTNNLLQFSRFQMGRFEYKPAELNLSKVVEKNINILKGNIYKKELNLIREFENDFVVYVDGDMLNSVLQNIISNAIKFTDRKGDIKVSVKENEIIKKPGQVEVIIKDSGIGIDEKKFSQLFKQGIKSTQGTEKEYGTGLGLLLVKEFVEQWDGSIKIKSELKKGTTIAFSIPLTTEKK